MKKALAVLMSLMLLMSAGCATKAENKVIRLVTTTSVNDSGLLPYILPDFEKESGYTVEVVSLGSGAAIKTGENGDADLLLVHSKVAEENFVASGFGIERIPFMHNYFVIAGSAGDPAGIADCEDAAAAFAAIYESGSGFISRGDESGTHTAEKNIWKRAELDPGTENQDWYWYVSAGAGMGACLNMANERLYYVLTDKATFLSMRDKLDIVILLERGEDSKNVYSLIACNPDTNKGINSTGAQALIDFMLKESTLEKIGNYGVEQYGEALFFPDYEK